MNIKEADLINQGFIERVMYLVDVNPTTVALVIIHNFDI